MAKRTLSLEDKEIFLQKISDVLFISDLQELADKLEISLKSDEENIIEQIDFSKIKEGEIRSLLKKISIEIKSREDDVKENKNFDF